MSGHFERVACTGCDEHLFVSSASREWFWCDGENRVFPMLTAVGYCHGCNHITIIGRPPMERCRTRMLWWADFYKRQIDEDPERFAAECENFPDVRFDFAARTCLAPDRVGLCLRCGGTFVTVIDGQEPDQTPRQLPVSTGVRHVCGGEIQIRDSGGIKTWPTRGPGIFDLAGRRIWGDPLPWEEDYPEEVDLYFGDYRVRVLAPS
ncbi:MAG: hypothetical protein KDJ82_11795 [Rhodobacteraceae bacterium]|jgi:hypothetical protein|nr:hypothetical protein [Paracoccaceae bacterium]